MSHHLIVLPDDTAKPIIDADQRRQAGAGHPDVPVHRSGAAACGDRGQKRGVHVRVMLNPARRSGENENEESRKMLKTPASTCATATPHSISPTRSRWWSTTRSASSSRSTGRPQDLTETRDYAVVTPHKHEVDEMVECFDADWSRKEFKPGPRTRPDLVSERRPRSHPAVHRRGETQPLGAERALSGPGDHRAPGARQPPRRQGARHGAAAPQAEKGQAGGRRSAGCASCRTSASGCTSSSG